MLDKVREVEMRVAVFLLVTLCACKKQKQVDTSDDAVEFGADSSDDGSTAGDDPSVDDTGSGLPVDTGGAGGDDGEGSGGDDEGGDDDPVEPPPEGFIGSPCGSDDDCEYDGGVCLTEGFPEGHCSVPCDRVCPDADGHPITFCVDGTGLPDPALSGGWCISRCSFGYFPGDGCREDYGCRVEARYAETSTETYACVPGEGTDLSSCQMELAERGVGFEPTIRAIDHPDGRPDKDCEIIEPVWVDTPLFGVDLRYVDSEESSRVLAGCDMAHALADTVEDVGPYGVSTLLHIGTYNCRMISGSESLSQHSFANAIDIYGFEFDDGHRWTLVDDWEHETTEPVSEGARFLYDASRRWYDDYIWNIILTPNFNDAHDNHFHVDLTPDYHDLSITSGRFYGPAPYRD